MHVPGRNVYTGAVDWPRAWSWLGFVALSCAAWALVGVAVGAALRPKRGGAA